MLAFDWRSFCGYFVFVYLFFLIYEFLHAGCGVKALQVVESLPVNSNGLLLRTQLDVKGCECLSKLNSCSFEICMKKMLDFNYCLVKSEYYL